MSRKPENQFVSGVHKYLPPIDELYRAKMNNPYTAGLPDWYYSGKKADIWIEYKYIKAIPKRDGTMIIPDLSEQQSKWLNDRYAEGRKVFVVVGCPEGGVVFTDLAWNKGASAADFRWAVMDRAKIARWIQNQVLPEGKSLVASYSGEGRNINQ